MARYKPEDDHPIGYWAFLRRPGVPNAPENGRRATTQYLLGWVGFFVVVALIVWGATALMGDSNTGTKPRPPRTAATVSDHRYARWSGPGTAAQVFTPQPRG
jgi:hypothetical protein